MFPELKTTGIITNYSFKLRDSDKYRLFIGLSGFVPEGWNFAPQTIDGEDMRVGMYFVAMDTTLDPQTLNANIKILKDRLRDANDMFRSGWTKSEGAMYQDAMNGDPNAPMDKHELLTYNDQWASIGVNESWTPTTQPQPEPQPQPEQTVDVLNKKLVEMTGADLLALLKK